MNNVFYNLETSENKYFTEISRNEYWSTKEDAIESARTWKEAFQNLESTRYFRIIEIKLENHQMNTDLLSNTIWEDSTNN